MVRISSGIFSSAGSSIARRVTRRTAFPSQQMRHHSQVTSLALRSVVHSRRDPASGSPEQCGNGGESGSRYALLPHPAGTRTAHRLRRGIPQVRPLPSDRAPLSQRTGFNGGSAVAPRPGRSGPARHRSRPPFPAGDQHLRRSAGPPRIELRAAPSACAPRGRPLPGHCAPSLRPPARAMEGLTEVLGGAAALRGRPAGPLNGRYTWTVAG
jgi:hypothetical protein